MAGNMGEFVKDYCSYRTSFSSNFRMDPTLDVLDPVSVKVGDSLKKAVVYDSSFNLSGAYKGKAEGVIFE